MAVTPRTVALGTRRWQAHSPWNKAHGGPPDVSPKPGSFEHIWPGLAVHLGQASSQLSPVPRAADGAQQRSWGWG